MVTKFIYIQFYGRPLRYIFGYMIILIFLWQALGSLIQTKLNKKLHWKTINILITASMIAIILLVTVSSRGNTSDKLILTPFYSFVEATTQPEIYRSMLMNVFLFFPLGLTLPYALPKKWKHNVLNSILFALILSIAIEFLQYYFCLGRAETDDVICNTLGCAIGTIAFKLNGTFEGNSNSN